MIKGLNELLSDIQVFTMNVRGYHWNIEGRYFFVLHEHFEKLYDELSEKGDEVAERIKMLGETPLHTYTDFIKHSTIKESKNVSKDTETVNEVIKGIEILMKKEKEIMEMAEANGDTVTHDLLAEYLMGQEKVLWMYRTFNKQ